MERSTGSDMKDITLKIVGTQNFDDIEEEQMEFVTDGRFYARGGRAYIIYDESEVSGMKRTGLAGFGTELYFEKGKRFSSIYNTPYGPMGIEVLTDDVKNELDLEEGRGSVAVQYQVSLEGIAEGKNRITIDIM